MDEESQPVTRASLQLATPPPPAGRSLGHHSYGSTGVAISARLTARSSGTPSATRLNVPVTVTHWSRAGRLPDAPVPRTTEATASAAQQAIWYCAMRKPCASEEGVTNRVSSRPSARARNRRESRRTCASSRPPPDALVAARSGRSSPSSPRTGDPPEAPVSQEWDGYLRRPVRPRAGRPARPGRRRGRDRTSTRSPCPWRAPGSPLGSAGAGSATVDLAERDHVEHLGHSRTSHRNHVWGSVLWSAR